MWKLKILKSAEKSLAKLDRQYQKKIIDYLDNICQQEQPEKKAKSLVGELTGLWRFRVQDFRIICKIDNQIITIVLLDIGHHKEIYK